MSLSPFSHLSPFYLSIPISPLSPFPHSPSISSFPCSPAARLQHVVTSCLQVMLDLVIQASKTFVIKRDFATAKVPEYLLFNNIILTIGQVLVEQALLVVNTNYGNHHVKFADCQIALGYFLLNVDQVVGSANLALSYFLNHRFLTRCLRA